MAESTGIACSVFDERMTGYEFGSGHPMAPVRVDLTMRLADELGLTGSEHLQQVGAEPVDDDMLLRVHTPEYVAAVRAASDDPKGADPIFGIGMGGDTPAFANMHEITKLIAGASVEAARRVWTGQAPRAANIGGGLHHAMPGHASGFGVYNDVALAIHWLLENGAERVAYVDVDAHHGDGVQHAFYNDPRVLTVSIHEGPQTLFPGTGNPTELGGEGAHGRAVNIALPPATADAGWLRAFHAVVPSILREFKPDVLVTQNGCDSHMDDPLTNLMLSIDGQRASYLVLRDLADELCGGKWVAIGGGGYALFDVVPRIWTHLLAIVADRPIDPTTPTPPEWRQHVAGLKGTPAVTNMTEGKSTAYRDWSEGYDPSTWLDRSIVATRKEVFPLYGLDPMP